MMGGADLPRTARVCSAADYASLRHSSGRLGGRCFHARYRENVHGQARLGLAISKRVSKRAVERNRIKRLLRESFRRVRHDLPDIDLVVMAREQASGLPGRVLLEEMDLLWKKLRALKPAASVGTMAR